MSLKSILTKLLSKNVHPAHQPHNPSPPIQPHSMPSSNQIPNSQNTDGSFIEATSKVRTIGGTDIGFGPQEIIQVDSKGQTKHLSKQESHFVGCQGKLVNDIVDIAGICRLCQQSAQEQFAAGLISVQQAQLLALFDKSSAAICNICGLQGCTFHIRPVQTETGVSMICQTCILEMKKQHRRQTIIRFLLAPITKTEDSEI